MADSTSSEGLVPEVSPGVHVTCSPLSCATPNTSTINITPADSPSMCQCDITPDILKKSFNITLKFLSPAASSGPFCRICREGDHSEDLVSLCKCTGSVGLLHITCLERWLNIRRGRDDRCEICNYTFETVRSPKSICEWYRSEPGSAISRNNVMNDLACFSLITPLVIVSTFLCLEAAKRQVMWNNSVEAGCLMALATFLITLYIVWNIFTLRFHFRCYLQWRSLNQNVRLVRFRRQLSGGERRFRTASGVQNAESGISISVPSCQ